ncbi:hypothetical protein [Actinomyces ruminis]|uniref:FtsX-like permease family protein n=1 Tax=Actinomyces ruminis TaxID=1937003 RepID=A0ABX4M8U7_9ACTO|nr:hypothetical protein [Actinomyces ruminis]PHP51878.1 hypothetical protein BW737_013770 [Actinomyces ruminis]
MLIIIISQASASILDSRDERQHLSEWGDTDDYGVLFPYYVGADEQEIDSGGYATEVTVASELYPMLDQAGALYIESFSYEPNYSPPDDPIMQSLTVNLNYLARYPVYAEDGQPLEIDPSEDSWIVAAPSTLKSQEEHILQTYYVSRNGTPEVEGVIQADEHMGLPVPEDLHEQDVTIIWTAPGQDVFTFNSKISPESGNTVRDPIIEIMTPSNSLVGDRLNSITGDPDTALKIFTDGDPESAYEGLLPTLQELGLDDNFKHLVTTSDAQRFELALDERELFWNTATAGSSLFALVVVLGASATVIYFNSQYRVIAVLRLHGASLMRTYSGLLRILGGTWLLALLFTIALGSLSSLGLPLPYLSPLQYTLDALGAQGLLLVAAVLCAAAAVEAAIGFLTALVTERISLTRRLKEL